MNTMQKFVVGGIAVILTACMGFAAKNKPSAEEMKQKFDTVEDARHVTVYQEKGHFAGWPANNGAWIFEGDEMLVCFTRGDYELRGGHNIGGNQKTWLARSTDGGETWKAYDPEGFVGDFGNQPDCKPVTKPIDFTAPKFALRMVGTAYHGAFDPKGHFFYTYDAGETWKGPHRFGDIYDDPHIQQAFPKGKGGYHDVELTPRTDYVIEGKHQCLLFMSVRIKLRFGTDKVFCARTKDGGKTFEFVSWVIPPYTKDLDQSLEVDLDGDTIHPSKARAVMSQTFELKDGTLITTMRRRHGKHNWVDAYVSKDNGNTWKFMAKVGDTGSGNGNPPALNMTEDGRLCAVFGDRARGTIMISYSGDNGKTWSKPKILRDDFWSEDMQTNDLGYPRLLRRSDGKMVALYYYSTKEALHGIQATIWDPAREK